jgi:hypothetical protein|tara:strand:- start:707 stop:904 length:198 start_codon:yes stop_codon:yes gene_type:complete
MYEKYLGVNILTHGSVDEAKYFCFAYQGQLITDGYGNTLKLEKRGENNLDRVKGFIECLAALGEI